MHYEKQLDVIRPDWGLFQLLCWKQLEEFIVSSAASVIVRSSIWWEDRWSGIITTHTKKMTISFLYVIIFGELLCWKVDTC